MSDVLVRAKGLTRQFGNGQAPWSPPPRRASRRQLAAFVWSEAIFVTLGGVLLGALAGWGLSFIIVKILTGVFDPPPAHLFVPWAYLATLGGVTIGAVAAAGSGVLRALRPPAAGIIRDL